MPHQGFREKFSSVFHRHHPHRDRDQATQVSTEDNTEENTKGKTAPLDSHSSVEEAETKPAVKLQPCEQTQSPIFRLPRELRDDIWSYLLGDRNVQVPKKKGNGGEWVSLCLTCKRLYFEVSQQFYRTSTFTFNAKDWSPECPDMTKSQLTLIPSARAGHKDVLTKLKITHTIFFLQELCNQWDGPRIGPLSGPAPPRYWDVKPEETWLAFWAILGHMPLLESLDVTVLIPGIRFFDSYNCMGPIDAKRFLLVPATSGVNINKENWIIRVTWKEAQGTEINNDEVPYTLTRLFKKQ